MKPNLLKKQSSNIINNEDDELNEGIKKIIKHFKKELTNIKESPEFESLKTCLNGGLGKQITAKFGNFKQIILDLSKICMNGIN